ncbi:MAG: PDC sensor domain-containing protein, partial [Gammaproteobacteria bacterium]|nr:PDC sensor domain-containing protein [Gammaproteobacteria bacterium]
ESIDKQRQELLDRLAKPMQRVASLCRDSWDEADKLNKILIKNFRRIPYRTYLYSLDPNGLQVTNTISREGLIKEDFGRDRSRRPYMKQLSAGVEFTLSEAYISLRKNRPSLTALQAITNEQNQLLGYLGVDFDLRDLPLTRAMYTEPNSWQQIKGDPAIRQGVFNQRRAESTLDQNIDTALGVLVELMQDHGIFHTMLHFSSNRAVIWQFEDPYKYRLLGIDALIDPNVCLAFPRSNYPKNAVIPAEQIIHIFEAFKQLRYMDDTLYLRTGTINIFNGIIGLTFSCDGSHYIPWQEFLDKDHLFWANTTA